MTELLIAFSDGYQKPNKLYRLTKNSDTYIIEQTDFNIELDEHNDEKDLKNWYKDKKKGKFPEYKSTIQKCFDIKLNNTQSVKDFIIQQLLWMVYDPDINMEDNIEIKLQYNGQEIVKYSSESWTCNPDKWGFPSDQYVIDLINRFCNVFDVLK